MKPLTLSGPVKEIRPRLPFQPKRWEPQWRRDKSVPVATYYMEAPCGTYRISKIGGKDRPWYLEGRGANRYYGYLATAKRDAEIEARRHGPRVEGCG